MVFFSLKKSTKYKIISYSSTGWFKISPLLDDTYTFYVRLGDYDELQLMLFMKPKDESDKYTSYEDIDGFVNLKDGKRVSGVGKRVVLPLIESEIYSYIFA